MCGTCTVFGNAEGLHLDQCANPGSKADSDTSDVSAASAVSAVGINQSVIFVVDPNFSRSASLQNFNSWHIVPMDVDAHVSALACISELTMTVNAERSLVGI